MDNKKSNILKRIVLFCWILFFAGVISVIALFALIANGKIGYMPPIEELESPKSKYASVVFSSDNVELGRFTQAKENRVFVKYNQLSPNLVKALIATEDARFSDHSGIDVKAVFRAVFKTVLMGQKNSGGGSTITQQLAKLLYSPSADNIIERAFQKPIEWVIAVNLERLYTKEEIINMYFNKFDFNHNAVGIKSAAKVYFGKTPSELSVEEAATLVGMCKNPSLYNPLSRNKLTTSRRNVVIEQMVKANYLTKAEGDSLKSIPLTLSYHKADHKEGLAPYFREYLRSVLRAKKPVKKNYASWQSQKFSEDSLAWETNPLFGWCNKNLKPDGTPYDLTADGLKIYTTIDSRMQAYAEEALTDHLSKKLQPAFFKEKKGRSYAPFAKALSTEEVEASMKRTMRQSERYIKMKKGGAKDAEILKAFNTPIDMQVFTWSGMKDTIMSPMDSIRYQKYFLRAGFMSMDPINGHVKAYVGGPDISSFQYDMVTSGRRQVGSTIKPFLYTLAMEEGRTPCDLESNTQPSLVDENGTPWIPRNSSKARVGEMVTLRWALANSNNWISARIMDKLSPYAFVRLLHSFGIRNHIDPVISLCLGPSEVSVEEMVTGYTAFANKGLRVDPLYVTRIEDNNGNIIANFTPSMQEVFSESTYNKILPMLRDVIDVGTGGRIRRVYGITAPMGGKTGTTNNNSDGWFMGFTPSLVSGVWVGGEERAIRFDNMAEGQGASMALPIYGEYMKKVYADKTLPYSQTEQFELDEAFDPCQGIANTINENHVIPEDEEMNGIFE
ncbi:MAG: transglycosylase domain-containing protein [Bacteroidales bacterium]|nr:transglycosylase domain-containing protein [Bacteroidales bacterium]